jgi:hypothetical protein
MIDSEMQGNPTMPISWMLTMNDFYLLFEDLILGG